MKAKLKNLDKYPKAQNFFLESEAGTESSMMQSPSQKRTLNITEEEKLNPSALKRR